MAYARWGRGSLFREWAQRRAPVVALCRPCHRRVTRWDRVPSWETAGFLAGLLVVAGWLSGPSVPLVVAGGVLVGLGLLAWLPLVTLAGLAFGWVRTGAVVVGAVWLVSRVA